MDYHVLCTLEAGVLVFEGYLQSLRFPFVFILILMLFFPQATCVILTQFQDWLTSVNTWPSSARKRCLCVPLTVVSHYMILILTLPIQVAKPDTVHVCKYCCSTARTQCVITMLLQGFPLHTKILQLFPPYH